MFSNITNKEEFYKFAAESFAGTAIIRRFTASVHVEGITDISFWKKIFYHFYPQGKFNFIAYSKAYPKNELSKAEASGSMHCLNYLPYLSDRFFVCIDSDERFLKEEKNINIKNYIFQTYTYSIENHYCYANKLNFACIIACALDSHTYLPVLVNSFFDFRVFLKKYSNIIYDIFLWHIYFSKNEIEELNILPFNSMITITGKIPVSQVKHNGESILLKISDRVQSKLKRFVALYPDFDIEEYKNYYSSFGITPDNVYLYVRGHNLFDFISKIGDSCCEYLLSKKNNSHLRKKTSSFKNVIIKKIWFDNYFCMNKIKEDIDYFFYTEFKR